MHLAAEERWPVLDGGPTQVTLAGEAPWRHDAYRLHLAGRGARLEAVRAQAIVMDQIRHHAGDALTLHADRVESHRGGALHDRWAAALELPVFVWERSATGDVSWAAPDFVAASEMSAERTRLVLRSLASDARYVFETSSGEIVMAEDGRITWTARGASRLVAIAAAGDADLDRSLDLLARRSIGGLGRQRAQHAEQLHRGGAAMRSAAIPTMADAFDWAKVRGDALLGRLLAEREAPHRSPEDPLPLAHALLAAGLSHLPRALRRQMLTGSASESARCTTLLATWTGEAQDASGSGSRAEAPHAEIADDRVSFTVPALDAIATGELDGRGVASFITGAITALWGIFPDAPGGAVVLAPDVTRLGASAALSRLRIGRTVLDVRVRSRGELVSIGIRRGAGPPIAVDCSVRGLPTVEVLVDGVAVAGGRARFEVREAHDVQFHLRGGPPLSSAPS